MTVGLATMLPSELGWVYGGLGGGPGPRVIPVEGVWALGPRPMSGPLSWTGDEQPWWLTRYGAALDVPLTAPSSQASVTLRALFGALREAGVRPHARIGEEDEEAGDEAVAREIVEAYMSATWVPRDEAAVTPIPFIGLAEGTFVRTSPVTSEARAALSDLSEFQADVRAEVGSYAQMLADIALMGAGRVRRLKQSETEYRAIFPVNELSATFHEWGDTVLPPGDLLAALRRDGYQRFGGSTPVVLLGLLLGVKLDFCPLLVMGGYRLSINANHIAAGDTIGRDDFNDATDSTGATATADAIAAGMPPWQSGFLVPSGAGWAPFYWDAPLGADARTLGTAPTQGEIEYQRLALYVWPTSAPSEERSPPGAVVAATPDTTWYARECARRKSLFVAAYATGLGEWLAALSTAIQKKLPGADIYSVVDTLELANEPDGYWEFGYDSAERVNAAMEVGRYLALLAGPVHELLPAMRFRVELHDWTIRAASSADPRAPHDDLDQRLSWFREVVTRGMKEETDWWRTVQRAQVYLELDRRGMFVPAFRPEVLVPAVLEWYRTSEDAGFAWPPRLFADATSASTAALLAAAAAVTTVTAPDLIHQVGYHWYHHTDTLSDGTNMAGETDLTPFDYATTNRLAADLRRFALLCDALKVDRFNLGVTVGEICFPACSPGDPAVYSPSRTRAWSASYYESTSPILQAAMYLRLLAVCVGEGTESAKLYTFNYGAELASQWNVKTGQFVFDHTTNWGTYSTCGVHNDVTTEAGSGSRGVIDQGRDLWPRPSWFAFRRFNWLLAHAGNGRTSEAPTGVRVVPEHDGDGVQVIEITFATPLWVSPEGHRFRAGWRRAYLVWLDQYAQEIVGAGTPSSVTLEFDDSASNEGYMLLPVVPEVTHQTEMEGTDGLSYAVDANGYSAISGRVTPNPNWVWEGWDSARDEAASSPELPDHSGAFHVEVLQCDPPNDVAVVPLLILTNAELVTS